MREAHMVRIEAEAPLPTRYGTFRTLVFRDPADAGKEHVALLMTSPGGGPSIPRDLLVRVHSECLTSEVFGSLKCDCALQLDLALSMIAHEGRGALIYLRQEGRGIGLVNKIRAYALQAEGLDTVDANRELGLPDDARDYGAAAGLLRAIGVERVRLMTNNPAKVTGLESHGIEVSDIVPSIVTLNAHSAAYVATKGARMHHVLPEPQGTSTAVVAAPVARRASSST
jgi:GTP cyclohydrolase II